jgi:hypothetical protein
LAESIDKKKIFGRPMHNGKIKMNIKEKGYGGLDMSGTDMGQVMFLKMMIKLQCSKM